MPARSIAVRLALLEAAADQVITERWAAYDARVVAIVGSVVSGQAAALTGRMQWGEISSADYDRQWRALHAPYQAAIEADPEVVAIWRTLGKAVAYQDMVERRKLRKRIQ